MATIIFCGESKHVRVWLCIKCSLYTSLYMCHEYSSVISDLMPHANMQSHIGRIRKENDNDILVKAVNICMQTCKHTHARTHKHTHQNTHTRTDTHTHARARTHTHKHTQTNARTHAHAIRPLAISSAPSRDIACALSEVCTRGCHRNGLNKLVEHSRCRELYECDVVRETKSTTVDEAGMLQRNADFNPYGRFKH